MLFEIFSNQHRHSNMESSTSIFIFYFENVPTKQTFIYSQYFLFICSGHEYRVVFFSWWRSMQQLYIAESNPSANFSSKHIYSNISLHFRFSCIFYIWLPSFPKKWSRKIWSKVVLEISRSGQFWCFLGSSFSLEKKRHYYHGQRNSRRIVNGHLVMPD